MKAKINQEACVGSQDCVDTGPEVFKMEGEKAVVHVAEVPAGLEDKCKSAADACPAAATTIEQLVWVLGLSGCTFCTFLICKA